MVRSCGGSWRPFVDEWKKLGRPGGPLFSYLAVEVFAGESTDVRELLRRTTPFNSFTADLFHYEFEAETRIVLPAP